MLWTSFSCDFFTVSPI